MSYHRLFALSKKKVIITAGYKTLAGFGQDEFTEKKSRFICCAKHIETETEAQAFISEICKKHWDARHNVYAYVLREGGVKRFSDDGEPQGTAGVPVLDVLLKEKLYDVCVVVTRYFGGILLGAGGLLRAYTKSAKDALDAAGISVVRRWIEADIPCSYSQAEKLKNEITAAGGIIGDMEYGAAVVIKVLVPEEMLEDFKAKIFDVTAGSVSVKVTGESFKAVPRKK